MAIGGVGLAGGGFSWWTSSSGSTETPTAAATEGALRPERELRPTLEPASYTGKARRAYEVAREIPGVLDRLKCYCRCEYMGHKSLLSCYTDAHAST